MSKQQHKGLVAGIDLGGTNIAVGIVDEKGKMVGAQKRKTKASLGRDAVVDRIVETLGRACEVANCAPTDLTAVGIGVPGVIDFDDGVVINSGNLGWKDEPIRDLLSKRLKVPVTVDNDANLAAFGEATLGAARGWKDVLAVWVGTGIGGGLVLGGEIYRGPMHTAGEIGYMLLMPRGGVGRRTVEDHCSRVAMVRAMETIAGFHPESAMRAALANRVDGELIGSSTIAKAYEDGDELCRKVVDDAADLLGIAIANIVTLMSVRAVVIGGGVAEAMPSRYIDRIRDSFEMSVFPSTLKKCRIVRSELGGDAGILGAAMLARGGGIANDS